MHPATPQAAVARPARDHRTARPARRASCGRGRRRARSPVRRRRLRRRPTPDDPARPRSPIFWWGGEARAKLTEEALALYTTKHPNVTFKTTWQANQGYFDKLATLTAGGDAPDIFQIDDNFLTEYAARSATLDLTLVPGRRASSTPRKFPESLWKYGVVDGKLAGVAFGENTQGMVYNKTKLHRARPAPSRRPAGPGSS